MLVGVKDNILGGSVERIIHVQYKVTTASEELYVHVHVSNIMNCISFESVIHVIHVMNNCNTQINNNYILWFKCNFLYNKKNVTDSNNASTILYIIHKVTIYIVSIVAYTAH